MRRWWVRFFSLMGSSSLLFLCELLAGCEHSRQSCVEPFSPQRGAGLEDRSILADENPGWETHHFEVNDQVVVSAVLVAVVEEAMEPRHRPASAAKLRDLIG